MSQDQGAFQARLDKIKAKEELRRPPISKGLPAHSIADLKSLTRNTKDINFSDISTAFWDIPTVRYGLPMILGTVGLALMSNLVGNITTHNMINQIDIGERMTQSSGFSPFGSNAIQNEAIARMNHFAAMTKELDELDN